jgi:hypothetical protein
LSDLLRYCFIDLKGSGPALGVEMTSYVLLTFVKLGSKEEMIEARSIVRWLSKQRNSQGGFISTQDTVVGLQVSIQIFKSSIKLLNKRITIEGNCGVR